MNETSYRFRATLVFAGVSLISACSTEPATPPEAWWPGVVVGVVLLSDVPPDTDRRCVQVANEPSTDERTVALVKRRIGRAPHTRAFLLAPGASLRLGERVLVDSDLCRIKPAPASNPKI